MQKSRGNLPSHIPNIHLKSPTHLQFPDIKPITEEFVEICGPRDKNKDLGGVLIKKYVGIMLRKADENPHLMASSAS